MKINILLCFFLLGTPLLVAQNDDKSSPLMMFGSEKQPVKNSEKKPADRNDSRDQVPSNSDSELLQRGGPAQGVKENNGQGGSTEGSASNDSRMTALIADLKKFTKDLAVQKKSEQQGAGSAALVEYLKTAIKYSVPYWKDLKAREEFQSVTPTISSFGFIKKNWNDRTEATSSSTLDVVTRPARAFDASKNAIKNEVAGKSELARFWFGVARASHLAEEFKRINVQSLVDAHDKAADYFRAAIAADKSKDAVLKVACNNAGIALMKMTNAIVLKRDDVLQQYQQAVDYFEHAKKTSNNSRLRDFFLQTGLSLLQGAEAHITDKKSVGDRYNQAGECYKNAVAAEQSGKNDLATTWYDGGISFFNAAEHEKENRISLAVKYVAAGEASKKGALNVTKPGVPGLWSHASIAFREAAKAEAAGDPFLIVPHYSHAARYFKNAAEKFDPDKPRLSNLLTTVASRHFQTAEARSTGNAELAELCEQATQDFQKAAEVLQKNDEALSMIWSNTGVSSSRAMELFKENKFELSNKYKEAAECSRNLALAMGQEDKELEDIWHRANDSSLKAATFCQSGNDFLAAKYDQSTAYAKKAFAARNAKNRKAMEHWNEATVASYVAAEKAILGEITSERLCDRITIAAANAADAAEAGDLPLETYHNGMAFCLASAAKALGKNNVTLKRDFEAVAASYQRAVDAHVAGNVRLAEQYGATALKELETKVENNEINQAAPDRGGSFIPMLF